MIINKCENCGKDVFTYPSQNRNLCSNKCRYEWQRDRKRISKKIGWNLQIIHNSRKGKKLEEIYGIDKALEIRNNLRNGQKAVDRNGKNNPFYGKTHTEEFIERLKKITSVCSKKRWENQEFKERTIRKVLKSLLKKPSSFEQKFINYFKNRNLNFEYVGDGKFFINGLNPDFICKERMIVVEVFYSWFKIRNYGSVENYISSWSKRYLDVGWKSIFISEEILEKRDYEDDIDKLILPFLEQRKL